MLASSYSLKNSEWVDLKVDSLIFNSIVQAFENTLGLSAEFSLPNCNFTIGPKMENGKFT